MAYDETQENKTFYEELGEPLISEIIHEFYRRVIVDIMIAYFFTKVDINHLIQKQIIFTSILFGSTTHKYEGKSMRSAHQHLKIRKAHVLRREVLLKDVLEEKGLSAVQVSLWLEKERNLIRDIVFDKC